MSHLIPQNPQSKFRAPQHEHLAATRAKPRPDLQSQKWICSSSKPCAKRMNVTQKRSVLPRLLCGHFSIHVVHFSSTILCVLSCLRLASLAPLFCSQVKNVYQSSFSAFLDSLDVSRGADFPQVGGDLHGACSAVML